MRIILPRHLFREGLRTLARSWQGSILLPLGRSAQSEATQSEWIVARSGSGLEAQLRLVFTELPPRQPDLGIDSPTAVLWVGDRSNLGRAEAWIQKSAGVWAHAIGLYLPGAGLPCIRFDSSRPPSPKGEIEADIERWSRTRGALGAETHDRLRECTIGLLGCGRTGSLIARNLTRLGIRQIFLADPDWIEMHNLGESEFHPSDIGLRKAPALARRLAFQDSGADISALAQSVSDRSVVDKLKQCELLIAAPDHPGARLAAGAIAAAYARPLLDVGTRIFAGGDLSMGGDVRLILPERCVLCFGGVTDEARGWRALESPDFEISDMNGRDWRAERPGSLRSLNEICAGIAQRMLEDLAAGRLAESTWCRVEFGRNGRLTVNYPEPGFELRRTCFCEFMGWGDAGLPRVLDVLRRRAESD